MEARWALKYALRDPAKWGRHIYVASLRQQRHWTSRLVVGTDEYHAFEEARRLNASFDPADSSKQSDYQSYIAALDRILAKPEFVGINQMFQGYANANQGREAEWYYDSSVPKSQRVTSIAKLAASVGSKGEYQAIYKYSSYFVHGSYTGTHLKNEPGAVIVAPLRTPEGWRQVFIFMISMGCDVFRQLIDQYRPGELQQFVKKYVEGWRNITWSTPTVEVQIDQRGELRQSPRRSGPAF